MEGNKLRSKKDFPKAMANKDTKLKLPHYQADIQALEDDLAAVAQNLRDLRSAMTKSGLATVELKTGTFRFYLTEMMQYSTDFLAEARNEVIRQDARRNRQKHQDDQNSKRKRK